MTRTSGGGTTMLPPPEVTEHHGVLVVRDDLIAGGTKRRALPALLDTAQPEVVYASPAYGYAQVAIAHAAAATGRRATIFVAKRRVLHPRTAEAQRAGAKIVTVSPGYLTVVAKRARTYAQLASATLLPFGLDTPAMRDGLADAARSVPLERSPREVWAVAGSGTLVRALQQAWPSAVFHAVRVGRAPAIGRALLHVAPEPFERDAKVPPPFPSCSNYDAKAWQFIRSRATPGALFWNVAA